MFEELPSIAPKVLYSAGSFKFTETMLASLIVTALLIIFAVVVRVVFIPRWSKDFKHISGFRALVEWLVGIFVTDSDELTEKYSAVVGPLYFGCSAYIMFGILVELFGFRAPLSDLNCDLVLGAITFIAIQAFGIIKFRWRRLRHFFPLTIPIITDSVVPFSMALRLFGSVFSGYLIMEIIYAVCPIVVPAFVEPLFTLFHAVIQSYVFMFLSMNFINEALE